MWCAKIAQLGRFCQNPLGEFVSHEKKALNGPSKSNWVFGNVKIRGSKWALEIKLEKEKVMTKKMFVEIVDKSVNRLRNNKSSIDKIKEEVFLKACLLTSNENDEVNLDAAKEMESFYWKNRKL